MIIPTKKLKNGFELPIYGLGIWQMGGRYEKDATKDADEIAAIKSCIDAGITHIDTAESYGAGHAEELLGQAIKGYARSKLFIATKVAKENQGYYGVHAAFKASLARLQTNYIDLYMLHRYPMAGISIKETMRAMNELADRGVVKYIGVCNLTPEMFTEAQKHSTHKLVCNQVHYNVQYREIEDKKILDYCQKNDVMLVAWRPVQKGELPVSLLMNELAEKYDKTPTQIAINWLTSQQNVVTISKTSNPAHLTENLGALGWDMSVEDIERVRAEYPNQKLLSDAVPLTYKTDL